MVENERAYSNAHQLTYISVPLLPHARKQRAGFAWGWISFLMRVLPGLASDVLCFILPPANTDGLFLA